MNNASKATGNLLSDLEQELSRAVERSRSHNEIVRIEVADTDAARQALCELYSATLEVEWVRLGDGSVDVYGYHVDAPEGEMVWRLHLTLAVAYYGTDTETYRVIGDQVRVASHETDDVWDASRAEIPADAVPVDGTGVDFRD